MDAGSIPDLSQITALVGTGGTTVAGVMGWLLYQMLQVQKQLAVIVSDMEWIKSALNRGHGD